MSRPFRWAVAVLAGVLVALAAGSVGAVPRYAVRYEQNCMLCHVNPTGGGMRSAYATDEIVPKELAMSPQRPEALAALDTHLNKAVRIGADLRNQLMLFSESSPFANQQGFFPMQGDVHLAFQLDPRTQLAFRRGQSSTTEFYYLGHFLPWGGYVKGGRFVPPYGWRFDDHTMYVRDALGLAPPANADAGAEIGLAPSFGDLQVAVVNGNRGSTLDNDRRLAVSGLASSRFRVGPLSAVAGVSGYTQPGLTEDLQMGGVFGALSGWNVTWVGEGDLTRRDPSVGPAVRGLVTSHELSVVLRQGAELLLTYDFLDPDRDLATGARSRWGGGLHVMPRSFVSLEARYRHTHVQSGRALAGADWDEGIFQVHLLY